MPQISDPQNGTLELRWLHLQKLGFKKLEVLQMQTFLNSRLEVSGHHENYPFKRVIEQLHFFNLFIQTHCYVCQKILNSQAIPCFLTLISLRGTSAIRRRPWL